MPIRDTLCAILLLLSVACAQESGSRQTANLDQDDLGHLVHGLNVGKTSTLDRMRLHPGNIIGGGAIVYAPIFHVAALEGATSGGTWLGYDALGAVSATDAPTIATSAANPRISGGNTTLITWDPNSAGGQAGQYAEFDASAALLNLYSYGFLRVWCRSSATTTAGELTLTILDGNRAAIGSAINFPAIGTADAWQAVEFDIRSYRTRFFNQIPDRLRITHTAPGAAETLRVEQMDAYQFSNGHGPVLGKIVQRIAGASLARGSLVAATAGQTDRVGAALGNSTTALGLVVEGWLTGASDSIIAPTADGDSVWVQMDGEVYLEVAAAVTPAVGDPVAVVSSTTFDDDEGAGRGIGTWREALAAGNHALVALDALGGNDDATLGALIITDDITWSATTPTLTINNTETITINDGTNTLMTLADGGTTGNLAVTGTFDVNGTANISDTTAGSNVTIGNSTGDVTVTSDAMTVNASPTVRGVATGTTSIIFRDFDTADAEDAASIVVNATDTTSGGEDVDVSIYAREAGAALEARFHINADGGNDYGSANTNAHTFTTDGTGTLVIDGSDIDTGGATALPIGANTATVVEIGRAAGTTDIQSPLTVLGGIDTAAAATLQLGAATATAVEIADTGVVTNIEGGLLVEGNLDTTAAAALVVGGTTATEVTIGRTGQLVRRLTRQLEEFEDFDGSAINPKWVLANGGGAGASSALTLGDYGMARLTAGTANNATAYATLEKGLAGSLQHLKPSNGKIRAEFRINLASVANGDFSFGLSAEAPSARAFRPTTGVYVLLDVSASANLFFGGNLVAPADTGDTATTGYHVYTITVDESGNADLYLDGTLTMSVPLAVTAATAMGIYVNCSSEDATSRNLDVDYVHTMQER